jgi:phage I-like protein
LPEPDPKAPDWIQLLPDNQDIVGHDGRHWLNDAPDKVANQTRLPLVLDYEHASEHRAPQGLDAPAAGWIDELQQNKSSAAIWGHVTWTERAKALIEAREYRFLSPVIQYEKPTNRVVKITSVALTNQPNLTLTALNRWQSIPTVNPADFNGNPDDKALRIAAQQTFAQVASIRHAFRTADAFFSHLKATGN